MLLRILLCLVIALPLAGCATSKNKKAAPKETVQSLQAKVETLERRVDEKDEEILALQDELGKKSKDSSSNYSSKSAGKTSGASASLYSPKDLQKALMNAGYYGGPLDGSIGPKTKQAIMDFQRDNGLKVDGIAGSQTWSKLKEYLDVK